MNTENRQRRCAVPTGSAGIVPGCEVHLSGMGDDVRGTVSKVNARKRWAYVNWIGFKLDPSYDGWRLISELRLAQPNTQGDTPKGRSPGGCV